MGQLSSTINLSQKHQTLQYFEHNYFTTSKTGKLLEKYLKQSEMLKSQPF